MNKSNILQLQTELRDEYQKKSDDYLLGTFYALLDCYDLYKIDRADKVSMKIDIDILRDILVERGVIK